MKNTLRQNKAITLIALVVTIVVLLILAGVSINLILDDNGIIEKSKEAKLETRASQVEDEIGLWKQNNFIRTETGESAESIDGVLQKLLSKKLLNEDEIDEANETITIKRKDGSILKEIVYGKLRIKISKNPETEKAGSVTLTVESVEGLTEIDVSQGDEQLDNFISSLNEETKKKIIKNSMAAWVNKRENSNVCTTFEKALDYCQDNLGLIESATTYEEKEQNLWFSLKHPDGPDGEEDPNGIDNFLKEGILRNLYYNDSTGIIAGYIITNPDGEISDTYTANANGTYQFTIKDVITDKTYTKTVEVTNIDTII